MYNINEIRTTKRYILYMYIHIMHLFFLILLMFLSGALPRFGQPHPLGSLPHVATTSAGVCSSETPTRKRTDCCTLAQEETRQQTGGFMSICVKLNKGTKNKHIHIMHILYIYIYIRTKGPGRHKCLYRDQPFQNSTSPRYYHSVPQVGANFEEVNCPSPPASSPSVISSVLSSCVRSSCVLSSCVLSSCVLSSCVLSSCVLSSRVLSSCVLSSCVL